MIFGHFSVGFTFCLAGRCVVSLRSASNLPLFYFLEVNQLSGFCFPMAVFISLFFGKNLTFFSNLRWVSDLV